MSGTRSAVNDVDVDLGQLFGALGRYWVRIVVFALVVAALAFAWAIMADPLYRAETRLLIEARESVYTRPSEERTDADQPLLDDEAITSQVEVISSSDILRDVARDLDLASRDEFGAESSGLRGLLVLLGLSSDPSQASVEERVLGIMREKLTVFRVEGSRVIVVRFSSHDPELAAAVPNAIAEAYITVQEQAKLASNTDATDWLEPEIADLRQRVREAEARVADYRAQADLFMGEGTSSLSSQQLSQLSTELTRVRAERSTIEARAEAIREALESGRPIEAMPDVLNAPLVQRLRERYAQLSSDRADLSASLLGNHPRIRALDAQIAETDQQLRAEMQKVLRSLESEFTAAQASERQLMADVNGLKVETARAEGDEVELRALEREAAAQRALLESYLTRLREASARADRNYLPADARVFSRATTPFEAYFPKVVPITAAALAGALLLAAVATLVAELFSGRAMRPAPGATFEPVEQVVMPAARQEPEPVAEAPAPEPRPVVAPAAVAPEAPPLPAREEISVEEAADRLVSRGAVRAVFVSPEGDDAGATSVMVARDLADLGLRVLFLDLTWSGAPSSSMLESGRYRGITNLLASEAQFADVIHGDLYSDCHVIPVGTSDRSRALRAAERLPIILASLNTAYDLVVVECGPTDADGVNRIAEPETAVLLSVIDPADAVVRDVAADLLASGYRDVVKVSPVGQALPLAPRGRSVA
ncbi:exopolysaccharide transport family protein [Mesorhizobium sp. CAU 1741]|uniref:GumC family protein n=1 Tax=Mesorhizobium sp. CAU 1741 TaxID=3140366 RepID=UPI00325C1589